jgi:hypothetical protein
MTNGRAFAVLCACVVSVIVLGFPVGAVPESSVAHAATTSSTASKRTPAPPVFAYYYIWFDRASWDRAKIDVPSLGKYSSDDPNIMRQHIRLAKLAGITGFIVSWKHSTTNDRRLSMLIDIAESEHFSLAMIYQGLDFYKRPLPAARVAADLDLFARVYAKRSPFRGFSKPLVIWSGTWKFSAADIKRTTQPVRNRILVLASERNLKGYERVAGAVDGDAYYWSSVNPDTFPGYSKKLDLMANAVHDRKGLWIAPAAPGFDARKIKGTTVVKRDDGRTLLRECATAFSSKPDILGLISWNEFTENTYVEPSKNYGNRYVDVAARCRPGTSGLPSAGSGLHYDIDSSAPGKGFPSGLVVVPAMLAVMAGAVFVSVRRRRQGPSRSDPNAASSKTTS